MSDIENEILRVDGLNISTKSNIFSQNKTPLIINSNFLIHKHEIVLIQGPNGSGKSSILKAITALQSRTFIVNANRKYKSKVLKEENDFWEMYKTIAYTEQKPDYGAKMAIEYVRISLDNYEYKKEVTDEDIIKMFNMFDKGYLLNYRISKFSGGEKRILSLISAFMRKKADLFILDEPLNDLDFETAKKVNKHLQILKETSGVLIISHCRMHLDADRAYLIKKTSDGGYLHELLITPKNCSIEDYEECHRSS
jgi:ABC-type multidrug transport system ATPase subunit